jgi:hypothetical protein
MRTRHEPTQTQLGELKVLDVHDVRKLLEVYGLEPQRKLHEPKSL